MKAVNDFKTIISQSGQGMEDFFRVIELPDEQFDAFYPQLKEKISEIYSSKAFREEVVGALAMNPIKDFEGEKAQVEEVIKTIKEEEDLSDNKKEFLCSILENSILSVYEIYENPREKINVKIKKLHEDAVIPTYAHTSDAGCDVYALEDVSIKPNETGVIVKTGIAMAIPKGYEVQVRPRSGMSAKTKLRIANAPGTIDSAYRGEIGIIIDNLGAITAKIEKGQKIAQLVIMPVPMMVFEEVEELDETDRGNGGFGSTGA